MHFQKLFLPLLSRFFRPVLNMIFIFVLTRRMHNKNTVNVINALLMVSTIFLRPGTMKSMAIDQCFQAKMCLITTISFKFMLFI